MAKYGNEAVRGLSALRKQFKALPEIARDALADATAETAEQIRAGAVRRVPVRFGFLRDHIAQKMNRKSGIAVVGIAKGKATTPDGKTVEPSRYAKFAEFGTVNQSAHPFMLPSAEEQREPYLRRAKDSGKTIERNMAAIGERFV